MKIRKSASREQGGTNMEHWGSSKGAKESVEGAKSSTMGHCEGAVGRQTPERGPAAFGSMKRLPPSILLINLNPIGAYTSLFPINVGEHCHRRGLEWAMNEMTLFSSRSLVSTFCINRFRTLPVF